MKIYQSKLLNNFTNLVYTFTTKKSGNLAFHVSDDPRVVKENHKLLASKLNYNKKTLVHMKQIHSDIVHIVEDCDNFDNPPTCDALITDKIDTPLMVMVADCAPILFYDDKQKVIAVAHAGRAGVFKNIVKNVIICFADTYNSNPNNIRVSIGPCIGSCCYEVGDEIYKESSYLELNYAMKKKDNSYYLDLKKILKTQLLECGIKKENLEFSNECSCCNNDTYFSYRADWVTGRFCGVISLS